MASRSGLFFLNRRECRKVADGLFFGLTVQGRHLVCFEAGDRPWSPSRRGRLVRFEVAEDRVGDADVLVDGLDNGCHQVDFFDGALFVVDTYNQQVLEFSRDWTLVAAHTPIPPARYGEWDNGYAHVNSFLGLDDSVFLLLHHGHRKQPSQILQLDRQFREQRRIDLADPGCHDLVRTEDGGFLVCSSHRGALIDERGPIAAIDSYLTRGLSVGVEEIAVGSSLFGARPVRALVPGFVTFLDRAYRRLGRLHVPAAPTQIRRLDGVDLSLSHPR